MRKLLSIVALVSLTGCANITTMKINRAPDGTLSINSGKDVTIGSLSYSAPSGEKLDVKEYTSNANSAAIAEQAVREKQIIDGLMNALQAGAAMAAKGAK